MDIAAADHLFDIGVWGPFHLGYSNNNEPELGRCRRTNKKRWRCARDFVPDQKHRQRHLNRGRHHSRKLVVGQDNDHSISGATKSTTTTKPMQPPAVAASSSTPMAP